MGDKRWKGFSIKLFENEEMYDHIENAFDAWSRWKTVKEEEHKISIRIKQFQEKSIKGPQNWNDQYRRGRDVS